MHPSWLKHTNFSREVVVACLLQNSPLGIAGTTLMATKFPCVTNVPCICVNSSLHDSILAPLVVTRYNYCTMPDKHSSHLGIPLWLQHFATAPWEIQTPPFTTPLLHPLWLHCLTLLMCIWQIPSNLAWLVHPSWLNCLTFTHVPHKLLLEPLTWCISHALTMFFTTLLICSVNSLLFMSSLLLLSLSYHSHLRQPYFPTYADSAVFLHRPCTQWMQPPPPGNRPKKPPRRSIFNSIIDDQAQAMAVRWGGAPLVGSCQRNLRPPPKLETQPSACWRGLVVECIDLQMVCALLQCLSPFASSTTSRWRYFLWCFFPYPPCDIGKVCSILDLVCDFLRWVACPGSFLVQIEFWLLQASELMSEVHVIQVTWLDLDSLRLEAQGMEGYWDYTWRLLWVVPKLCRDYLVKSGAKPCLHSTHMHAISLLNNNHRVTKQKHHIDCLKLLSHVRCPPSSLVSLPSEMWDHLKWFHNHKFVLPFHNQWLVSAIHCTDRSLSAQNRTTLKLGYYYIIST